MFRMIGKIICAVLAVLCFGYAGMCLFTNTSKQAASIVECKDYNVHPENEGKLVMMKGKLTYKGQITEDPELGVRIKSPILQRHTEMYQYIPSSSDEKTRIANQGWDKNGQASFTDKYKRYRSNPTFPSVPRSKDFACDLTMENGNLKIDGDFVKALSYRQYVNFKDHYEYNMVGVTKLPSKKIPEGFRNIGNQYYRLDNQEDENALAALKRGKPVAQIGDIRIRYQAFKWNENLPEFTIIGWQISDKLYRKDGALFFDYRVEDEKQLEREIRSNNRSAMFGAAFCGALLALAAVFI